MEPTTQPLPAKTRPLLYLGLFLAFLSLGGVLVLSYLGVSWERSFRLAQEQSSTDLALLQHAWKQRNDFVQKQLSEARVAAIEVPLLAKPAPAGLKPTLSATTTRRALNPPPQTVAPRDLQITPGMEKSYEQTRQQWAEDLHARIGELQKKESEYASATVCPVPELAFYKTGTTHEDLFKQLNKTCSSLTENAGSLQWTCEGFPFAKKKIRARFDVSNGKSLEAIELTVAEVSPSSSDELTSMLQEFLPILASAGFSMGTGKTLQTNPSVEEIVARYQQNKLHGLVLRLPTHPHRSVRIDLQYLPHRQVDTLVYQCASTVADELYETKKALHGSQTMLAEIQDDLREVRKLIKKQAASKE